MPTKTLAKTKRYGDVLKDHLFSVHEWSLDIEKFAIYLIGEPMEYSPNDQTRLEPGVEYLMANRFIKNLQILSNLDSQKAILIHMKTCGGEWAEGMAIYDAIRTCPNRVTILSYTHSRSMSSIIFQAADKRVMMPHSYFLFHEGTLSISGTYKQVLSIAEFEKKIGPTMLNIYVEKMKEKGKYKKLDKKSIHEMLQGYMNRKEDVFLTAREAVEWGLADEIFSGNWENLRRFSNTQLQRNGKKAINPIKTTFARQKK
ncbi:MAG: ATP-dependent Clp protease proteolytic subunit [Parcubacteria group bacterium]|nr:ATP-dependent Clp protease proteolytic subunit [Parcubacteria group bacterium]